MTHEELLADLNRNLPPLDWKAGVKTYLEQWRVYQGASAGYVRSKPFRKLGQDPHGTDHAAFFELVENLLNMLKLARLPGGSRILNVACGAGWAEEWLTRLGYDVTGVDLSDDPIAIARQRSPDARFFVCDVECESIPNGPYDCAFMESCLHHFVDPVSALRNVRNALAPQGIILCTENEAQDPALPIRDEYVAVMKRYSTLERPLSRKQLETALDLADLRFREFFCQINGWFSTKGGHDPSSIVREYEPRMNRFAAAATPEALRRVVPWL